MVFNDVSFVYPGTDSKILSHVSFRTAPGEKIAVIRPTASRKISLVNLAPRLYDVTSRRVSVNSVDVHDCCLENMYARLGYVP